MSVQVKVSRVACALGLVSGCVATETGNPVTEQRLALTARSTVASVELGAGEASDAGTRDALQVDEAWIVLRDFRFVQSDVCDGGDAQQSDIEGPVVTELVSHGEVLDFALPSERYCRVRVKLDRAQELPSGAPAALEDHAIVVRGQTQQGVPFTLASRNTDDLDLRSRAEPFELSQARARTILAFDVGTWLRGVDFDAAEVGEGGAIVIDDEHNREWLQVFDTNVEAALELFSDDDGDGSLDDDEARDALAGGE